MNNKKQKSFIKTIENIWYHYKFIIVACIVIGAFMIMGLAQSLSRKEPDVFIYHISTQGLTARSIDSLRNSLERIADDYNDDGIVSVDFKEEIYVPNQASGMIQGQLSANDSFDLELFAGECVIYIMDETFYKENRDYFVSFAQIFGYIPDAAYDDKAVMLSMLPFYKSIPGVSDLPEDSYICLRKRRIGLNEMDDKVYQNNVDFFERLMEFSLQQN